MSVENIIISQEKFKDIIPKEDRPNYQMRGIVVYDNRVDYFSTEKMITSLRADAQTLGATHVFHLRFKQADTNPNGSGVCVVMGDAYKQTVK